MNFSSQFSYGIIVGYYGDVWSAQALHSYAAFCKRFGHSFFIYAPKGDEYLRRRWSCSFSEKQLDFLTKLRQTFNQQNILFGIALSPYGLNQLDKNNEKLLKTKIEQINTIKPDILGVFFDDLTKEDISDNLAKSQIKIAEYAASCSNADHFITVPTYYSYDTILTQVLGRMPADYLKDFAAIEKAFAVFWTGQHILSRGYCQSELQSIADILQRKPFIWDNYPVNDTSYLHSFLPIFALSARSQKISNWSSGFALNPMSQPYMSMIPMSSAWQLFNFAEYNERRCYLDNMTELCGGDLARSIDDCLNYFTINGLSNLEKTTLLRIRNLFDRFHGDNEKKFTTEIIALIDQYTV